MVTVEEQKLTSTAPNHNHKHIRNRRSGAQKRRAKSAGHPLKLPGTIKRRRNRGQAEHST
jgi:hypothetical protein